MLENGETELFTKIDFDFLDVNEEGEVIEGAASEEGGSADEEKTTKTKSQDPSDEGLIEITTSSANEGGDNSANTQSKTDDSNSSSTSPLSSITAALGAEGLLTIEEEELKNVENPAQFLRDKFNEEVERRAAALLSEEEKEAFAAYKQGVPLKELVNSKARETQYASYTDDAISNDPKLQSVFVKHSLQAKGMSAEEAEELVKTYADSGEDKLKEKALEAKTFLVENEKKYKARLIAEAKEREINNKKQREDKLKEVKTFVDSQKEVIPNLELTTKVKEDVYKLMTTSAGEVDGHQVNAVGLTRSKDPIKFEFLLSYYHSLGLFNETPDFSKLMNVAETKVANKLDSLFSGDTSFIKEGGKTKSVKGTTIPEDGDLGLDFI